MNFDEAERYELAERVGEALISAPIAPGERTLHPSAFDTLIQ